MPERPEGDTIEQLLAAEEAAIRDDGFSARVAESAGKSAGLRSFILYGAGLTGLGFAVGGIVQLAPRLPWMGSWTSTAAAGFHTAVSDMTPMLQNGGTVVATIAVAALVFSMVAAASQGR